MPWAASVEISDDPVEAAWQLAAIAPLGPLDQVGLLGAESMHQLLISLIELTDAAAQSIGESWPEDDD